MTDHKFTVNILIENQTISLKITDIYYCLIWNKIFENKLKELGRYSGIYTYCIDNSKITKYKRNFKCLIFGLILNK